MDGSPVHSNTLASVSKDWDKVVGHEVDSNLPGTLGAYVSRGKKRNFNSINRPISVKDDSSLDLGLWPTSSPTTRCSPRVAEGGLSLDLCLNLKIGANGTSSPNKAIAVTRSALDLQLSLSTGTIESDVTTVTQEVAPCQNSTQSPVLVPVIPLVDEGLRSSHWKEGHPVLPLKSQLDLPQLFNQDSGCCNPAELNSPSSAVVPSVSCVNSKGQQRKSNVKGCRFEGCNRGARGASGLCIAHGGGRRCQKAGCQKGAEGKTVFCKAHGGGKRCQHLGCTKSAEGRTEYCISHGGGRRCSHEDCVRAARGKSGLCIRHGGGKRCKMENCTKSAEGISGLCISHGGGRRCQFPECTKGAQGSTMFCKAHGGGRRCTFLGCIKGAEGSTPFCKGHGGGKRCTAEGCTKSVHGGTLFCVGHGGGKRCSVPDCTKSARGRTNYCVRHGGGKRCKFEGCPKSAQGSTDFCKAHGGGRRCSWGHQFSEFCDQDGSHCDKFARGKSGLCAAHSAQMQEKLHSMVSLGSPSTSKVPNTSRTSYSFPGSSGNTNRTISTSSICHGYSSSQSLPVTTTQRNLAVGTSSSTLDQLSLPEGRVHGGSLMAMLARGTTSYDSESDDKLKSVSERWIWNRNFHPL